MERIPILRIGDLLLVSIQVDMHDRLAMALQDDLTAQVQKTGAKGVLIDISALDMVDSFIGRMISNLSRMSHILDARTVVVGMRPAVAITLVELGLSLEGVDTALDVERDLLVLGQRGHARAFDRGDLYEHIFGAVLRCDEAVTFGGVEKLYGAGSGHNVFISIKGVTIPRGQSSAESRSIGEDQHQHPE